MLIVLMFDIHTGRRFIKESNNDNTDRCGCDFEEALTESTFTIRSASRFALGGRHV